MSNMPRDVHLFSYVRETKKKKNLKPQSHTEGTTCGPAPDHIVFFPQTKLLS